MMEINLKARKDPKKSWDTSTDMDPVFSADMHGRDGVHFNERGNETLAQHIIRWLNGGSMMLEI